MADEFHISSLIVQARPDRVTAVGDRIAALGGAEISHLDPIGKIIVILETATASALAERITTIQSLPGVLNAALVYHHTEEQITPSERSEDCHA